MEKRFLSEAPVALCAFRAPVHPLHSALLQDTGGSFAVAESYDHLVELLKQRVPPPPAEFMVVTS